VSVPRGTSPLAIALAAGIREIATNRAQERAGRRATMTAIQGGRTMTMWARRTDDVFAVWHILGEPRTGLARGVVTAACGTTLGSTADGLEQAAAAPDLMPLAGSRCSSCQGLALREHAS
jgi:hypothetical protein